MEGSKQAPSDFVPKAEELLLLVKQLQNAGTLEPHIDNLVGRISKLQKAKQALTQELNDGKVRSEELQGELDELNDEKSNLEEICSQKQEVLLTLRLHCQETEAEAQRQQTLSQERKQSIEELAAKIQEEKLKQRKQRLEFEQQLDELMEKHKTLQEWHSTEKLAVEICSLVKSKECLLSEDKVIQDKLAQVEKQLDNLDTLPQAGAVSSEERMFLKSQEASTALELFQQENTRATEYLEAVTHHHSELQQKYKRLMAELEAQQQRSRDGSASMETAA